MKIRVTMDNNRGNSLTEIYASDLVVQGDSIIADKSAKLKSTGLMN